MGVHKKTRKFAQVKRIIGQRDARLKKNQDTGKTVDGKKKDDDVIREVWVTLQRCSHADTDSWQTASIISTVLPVQYSAGAPISGPRRYQLPLTHGPEKTRDASDHDGLSVCEVHAYHHRLRHGRT